MTNRTFFRRATSTVAILALYTATARADDAAPETAPAKSRPSRVELRDKQYDVSLDAREIERILTRLKRASELSKQRMTEAAEAAESVAGSIERDPVAARARAEETAKMFQEIATLLEALLTEETPQKIAAARNMAAQLAKAEQQFAQQTQAMSKAMMQTPASASGQGKPDPKLPPNPNPSKGQGGTTPQPEPTDKPNGNAPRPESADGKSGDKPDPTTPPKDPQGNGKNPREPRTNEKPEGTGGKPEENADKDQTGQDGAREKPSDKDKTGSGSGMPDKDQPEEQGVGGGSKPKDKAPADPNSNGGGEAADKDDMPADKQPPAGGGTGDQAKTPAEKMTPGSGGGRAEKRPLTEEERREQLAGRAAALAARAATLLDILDSIAQSPMPEDQTAAEKVTALLKETDLKKAVEAMQSAADQIRSQKPEDAQATALDVADRFQITTQRLDSVYRALVGPQAEELRKLEQQLGQLHSKLDELQTPAQVVAWHRAVAEMLDKADELGISEKRREDLLAEMKQNGFSVGNVMETAKLQFADGRFMAPPVYKAQLIELQEEIQSRIQSLVLGDFASMTDDLAPPKYQGLVERYYQVLSREGSTRAENPPATTNPKAKPAMSKDKK